MKLAVAGAAGRMGRAILRLALADPFFKITGALEHPKCSALGQDLGAPLGSKAALGVTVTADPAAALKGAEVLIDFTHPSATPEHLKAALKARTGLVVGTTGLDAKILASLEKASSQIPIVQSPNMSIGVNLLFKLSEMTAKALDEDYDIEIVEAHHRMKKDAPSGTALKLLECVARARGRDVKKNTVYGREGETGARPRGEIGVLAVRGGDVVGDHTVYFFAEGERIELTHRASSREAFAQGALRAAKFLSGRRKGFYTMRQVLGISD